MSTAKTVTPDVEKEGDVGVAIGSARHEAPMFMCATGQRPADGRA